MSVEGNLADAGQRLRLRLGIFGLAATIGMAIPLIEGPFPAWMRALIFIPAMFAAAGAMEGLYRVCPSLERKGMRTTHCDGCIPISDPELKEHVHSVSRRIMTWSVLIAMAFTGLTFFF